jgi:hypothetical protein
MKTWVKVVLGIGAAVAAVGTGVAFLGKKHGEDEDYAEVEETELNDSDSDEEAE